MLLATTRRQGHEVYHGVKNIMLQARALPSTGHKVYISYTKTKQSPQ